MPVAKIIIISLLSTVIGISGDYCIKKASLYPAYSGWKFLLMGGCLYAITAIGWFWIYRWAKVFTVGMIHSYLVIVLTILLSVLVFKEKITIREIGGILLGLLSLFLLLQPETE